MTGEGLAQGLASNYGPYASVIITDKDLGAIEEYGTGQRRPCTL